jgi:hypothetical protein
MKLMMKTKTLTQHINISDIRTILLNIGTIRIRKTLGVILSNEPTRIEISFDILDDLGYFKTYGVTTIEIDRGAGQKKCGNCHRF